MIPLLSMSRMQAAIGTLLSFSERQRDWLLVLSLACLYGALLLAPTHPLGRALLFAHAALCLLWQPLWRAPDRLTRFAALALAVLAAVTVAWPSQWLLCLWIAFVLGVLGGQVFIGLGVWQRTVHWLALLYLMVCLLLWTVPLVSAANEDSYLFEEMRWFLGILLAALWCSAAIAQFTQRARSPGLQRFDLVYAALLFLVALVLALGSITLRAHGQTVFLEGLVAAMLTLAAILLVVNMLWEPRFGLTGLGVTFSRYLRTLGLALEQWLRKITALSEEESEPAEFLQAAVLVLLDLPQVTGVAWIAESGYGVCGTQSPTRQTYSNWQLDITLYTDRPIGAALHAHFSLLLQVLAALYLAKLRESQLRTNAYVQAIHETGARLTHDVKNLLQSLKALCAAALDDQQQPQPREDPFRNLIGRQLPQIVVRLESTLEKLRAPARESTNLQRMERWWTTLLQRYDRAPIEFTLDAAVRDADIPSEVFDGVADNLLQNALEKRKLCPDLHIVMHAQREQDEVVVQVTDNGPAMQADRARQLFAAPLASSTGFGVGLYQAARMAGMRGFRLLLAENRDGCVVFELRG